MKSYLNLFLLSFSLTAAAQSGYTPVKGYWDGAGHTAGRPLFSQTRSILDFGADPGGRESSANAVRQAVASLGNHPGVIEFPAGNFFFDAPLDIERDSIVFRGAGYDSTRLRFDLGGRLSNLVNITGRAAADSSRLLGSFLRGDSVITVENAALFQQGDWVTISIDDAAYMSSDWAFGTLSQTMQVRAVAGNRLYLRSRARFNYTLALRPRIRRVIPRNNVGFECLGLERLDATSGQTSNIVFDRAVNCWISGIESDKANFAHVELNRASNIEIRNSWFHDAFAYGGGGQGYGVLLQTGSSECLVSGNYFRHLRHSMLLQSGANGNVLGYNYSTKPYWTETGLPDSSAGEIVLHGNFPFMNLAEGNIVNNIVIDDSHGVNGPLNTFFRNRSTGFGIFMNFSRPTDSVQFIGNEVTNPATGLYFLSGRGHFQFANNQSGTVRGINGSIPDKSLYLAAGVRPECSEGLTWPAIGEGANTAEATNAAKRRVESGRAASCGACLPVPVSTKAISLAPAGWRVMPNPAREYVRIEGPVPADQVTLFDASGRCLLRQQGHSEARVQLPALPAGLYYIRIQSRAGSEVQRLMIRD